MKQRTKAMIAVVGFSVVILTILYFFFFNRVGYFVQFQSESDLRIYLESNFDTNETTSEDILEFMADKLIYYGEFCSEVDYGILCFVHAENMGLYGVWQYEIRFRFTEDLLSEIDMEMGWFGV